MADVNDSYTGQEKAEIVLFFMPLALANDTTEKCHRPHLNILRLRHPSVGWIYSRFRETGSVSDKPRLGRWKTSAGDDKSYLPRSQWVYNNRWERLHLKFYFQTHVHTEWCNVTHFIRTVCKNNMEVIRIAEFNFVNRSSHKESERMMPCLMTRRVSS